MYHDDKKFPKISGGLFYESETEMKNGRGGLGQIFGKLSTFFWRWGFLKIGFGETNGNFLENRMDPSEDLA